MISAALRVVERHIPEHQEKGIFVSKRRERDFDDTCNALVEYLYNFVRLNRREHIELATAVERLGEKFDWSNWLNTTMKPTKWRWAAWKKEWVESRCGWYKTGRLAWNSSTSTRTTVSPRAPLDPPRSTERVPPEPPGPWLLLKKARDEMALSSKPIFFAKRAFISARTSTLDFELHDPSQPCFWIWVRPMIWSARLVMWQWEYRINTPPALAGCPKCGSTEIYWNQRIRLMHWLFGLVMPTLLWRVICDSLQPKNVCYRCNHRWPWRNACRPFPSSPQAQNEFPTRLAICPSVTCNSPGRWKYAICRQKPTIIQGSCL